MKKIKIIESSHKVAVAAPTNHLGSVELAGNLHLAKIDRQLHSLCLEYESEPQQKHRPGQSSIWHNS